MAKKKIAKKKEAPFKEVITGQEQPAKKRSFRRARRA